MSIHPTHPATKRPVTIADLAEQLSGYTRDMPSEAFVTFTRIGRNKLFASCDEANVHIDISRVLRRAS